MAPTAASAVFAGAFVGSLAIGTAGMIIAGSSSGDRGSWDKAADGFMWGSIAGAVIGGNLIEGQPVNLVATAITTVLSFSLGYAFGPGFRK